METLNKQELTNLVMEAQRGNEESVRKLMEYCYPVVYLYVSRKIEKEDDADNIAQDIVQDTFVEILNRFDKISAENFTNYLLAIARRNIEKYFKIRKMEILVEPDENGETIFDQIVDELTEEYEMDLEGKLFDIINSLPQEQKEAVLLYYLKEKTVSEIADIQNTTENIVKSRISFARKTIVEKLNK